MKMIPTARQIAHSPLLPVRTLNIGTIDRLSGNSAWAEAIIERYKPAGETDLPSVDFVYQEMAAQEAAESVTELNTLITTINNIRLNANILNQSYMNRYYLSVQERCELLINRLEGNMYAAGAAERIKEVYRDVVRTEYVPADEEAFKSRMREIVKESGLPTVSAGGTFGRSGMRTVAGVRKTANAIGRVGAGFGTARGISSLTGEQSGYEWDAAKTDAGSPMLQHMPMIRDMRFVSEWTSQRAKQFFWRVQRATDAEREIILQSTGVGSLISLEKMLRTMNDEGFRRFTEELSVQVRTNIEDIASRAVEEERLRTSGIIAGSSNTIAGSSNTIAGSSNTIAGSSNTTAGSSNTIAEGSNVSGVDSGTVPGRNGAEEREFAGFGSQSGEQYPSEAEEATSTSGEYTPLTDWNDGTNVDTSMPGELMDAITGTAFEDGDGDEYAGREAVIAYLKQQDDHVEEDTGYPEYNLTQKNFPRVEPVKEVTKRTEIAREASEQTQTERIETAKSDSTNPAAVKDESTRTESIKDGSGQTESAGNGSEQIEFVKDKSVQTESVKNGSTQTELEKDGSEQTEHSGDRYSLVTEYVMTALRDVHIVRDNQTIIESIAQSIMDMPMDQWDELKAGWFDAKVTHPDMMTFYDTYVDEVHRIYERYGLSEEADRNNVSGELTKTADIDAVEADIQGDLDAGDAGTRNIRMSAEKAAFVEVLRNMHTNGIESMLSTERQILQHWISGEDDVVEELTEIDRLMSAPELTYKKGQSVSELESLSPEEWQIFRHSLVEVSRDRYAGRGREASRDGDVTRGREASRDGGAIRGREVSRDGEENRGWEVNHDRDADQGQDAGRDEIGGETYRAAIENMAQMNQPIAEGIVQSILNMTRFEWNDFQSVLNEINEGHPETQGLLSVYFDEVHRLKNEPLEDNIRMSAEKTSFIRLLSDIRTDDEVGMLSIEHEILKSSIFKNADVSSELSKIEQMRSQPELTYKKWQVNQPIAEGIAQSILNMTSLEWNDFRSILTGINDDHPETRKLLETYFAEVHRIAEEPVEDNIRMSAEKTAFVRLLNDTDDLAGMLSLEHEVLQSNIFEDADVSDEISRIEQLRHQPELVHRLGDAADAQMDGDSQDNGRRDDGRLDGASRGDTRHSGVSREDTHRGARPEDVNRAGAGRDEANPGGASRDSGRPSRKEAASELISSLMAQGDFIQSRILQGGAVRGAMGGASDTGTGEDAWPQAGVAEGIDDIFSEISQDMHAQMDVRRYVYAGERNIYHSPYNRFMLEETASRNGTSPAAGAVAGSKTSGNVGSLLGAGSLAGMGMGRTSGRTGAGMPAGAASGEYARETREAAQAALEMLRSSRVGIINESMLVDKRSRAAAGGAANVSPADGAQMVYADAPGADMAYMAGMPAVDMAYMAGIPGADISYAADLPYIPIYAAGGRASDMGQGSQARDAVQMRQARDTVHRHQAAAADAVDRAGRTLIGRIGNESAGDTDGGLSEPEYADYGTPDIVINAPAHAHGDAGTDNGGARTSETVKRTQETFNDIEFVTRTQTTQEHVIHEAQTDLKSAMEKLDQHQMEIDKLKASEKQLTNFADTMTRASIRGDVMRDISSRLRMERLRNGL